MVQPMIGGGTEVLIGVADGRLFGLLVVFGLGGVATEVLADDAAQLTPLTDVGADTLIRSIRSAPLLLGHRVRSAAVLDPHLQWWRAQLRRARSGLGRGVNDVPVTDRPARPEQGIRRAARSAGSPIRAASR
jgi:ATP-grasp domain